MRISVRPWIGVVVIALAVFAVAAVYGASWTHQSRNRAWYAATPGTGRYLSRGATLGPVLANSNQPRLYGYRVGDRKQMQARRRHEVQLAREHQTPQAKELRQLAIGVRPSPHA